LGGKKKVRLDHPALGAHLVMQAAKQPGHLVQVPEAQSAVREANKTHQQARLKKWEKDVWIATELLTTF
jgi:hypothetical protein